MSWFPISFLTSCTFLLCHMEDSNSQPLCCGSEGLTTTPLVRKATGNHILKFNFPGKLIIVVKIIMILKTLCTSQSWLMYYMFQN